MRFAVGIAAGLMLLCTMQAAAVDPLSEKQLKSVCQAFAESKRSVQGQICGHYVLGFIDGDTMGGDPRRICIPDTVKLVDAMNVLIPRLATLKTDEQRPARMFVVDHLSKEYPCAKARSAPKPAPAPKSEPAPEAEPEAAPEP